METEKFNKLPKWAQIEITRLTRNLEYAEQQINQINGDSGTNVFIYEGMGERPLPKDTTIRFKVPNGTFDVDIRDSEYLLIHGNSSGDLVIKPRVSNGFSVSFNKD